MVTTGEDGSGVRSLENQGQRPMDEILLHRIDQPNVTEVYGNMTIGQNSDRVISSISATSVISYLQCVAADFNSDLSICTIFGSRSYSGLTVDPASHYCVRIGFARLSV
ncbi:hypothetical protein PoB_000538400 [Plakobranchus ocellatus]|uniref:Uncharacterized protein n=1 Tax=Plakobranchus ocellatus TaxID=259542 RepID=A0AAV3Y9X6_9GAST|nr:hypothetical protein PoB_000538400 [Plakobranchus ocellatus]